jgi:signal transduction histidine kinase
MLTSRAERLVAGGRVVLASFSLLAIYFDPTEPAKYEQLTYGLLALFVAYALAVALWTWPRVTQARAWAVTTHVIDLLFFSVLIYFTEGPVSPFFVYFVFALFSASLRLNVTATIWTAIAAVSIFLALGFYATQFLEDTSFELNRFLVRSVYLVVMATLLVHLASYEQRVRREVERLASWPRGVPHDLLALVNESITMAAETLHSPRVMLAWREEGVPRLFTGTRGPAGLEIREEVGDHAETLVGSREKRTMVVRYDRRPEALVHTDHGGFEWRDDVGLDRELCAAFHIERALVTFFQQKHLEGAVLFLDSFEVKHEDISVGAIVARVIGARLEQLSETRRAERAAVSLARAQLGRDLHDSLLQSLTGTALQLEMARRMIARDPGVAQQRLAELQELIASEQRELRQVVEQLQRERSDHSDVELGERFSTLALRLRSQWDLHAEIESDPLLRVLSPLMKHEVFSIVSEALANAAKHAGASRVTATVALRDSGVAIEVVDDGRGFAFHGRYDLAQLTEHRRGPVTLRERVASLGGDLVIESSSTGARLLISLPLAVTE